MTAEERQATREWDRGREPSNKRMKLTSLVAAPGWQDEVPPRAPHGKVEGRSGSQLIRGVGRALRERDLA